MKVCILTSVHPPFDTRIFHKEAKTLVKAGYEVTLIAQHDKDEIVDGIRLVPIPKPRNRFQRMSGLTFRALKLALRQKADIYHFHDPELIPAGVFLKLMGKKVIYDVHEDVALDIQSKDWLPKFFRKSVAFGFDMVEQFSARIFNNVVTATPDIGRKFPADKTVIVSNMPILEMIDSAEPLSIKKGKPVVIYVGGLAKIRGTKEMVQAAGLLGGKVELWLLGSFDDRVFEEEIKSMEQFKFVKYLGFKPMEEVYSYVKIADVGVVNFLPEPNHLNAMPNKIFEYMACSIPIIASNFPLWKEIVEGNNCGLTVNPLNPREIAKAFEYLIEHQDEAKKMGQNGRKAVLEKYNWGEEETKLLDLYERLLIKGSK